MTDQRKGTSTTHYDAKGRVDWVADAAGHKTTLTYDEVTGRTIAQTDALGNTTRTGYDVKGNVIHVWGDATYPVSYVYDPYGRKTEMRTYRTAGVDWNQDAWPTSSAGEGDSTTWIYDASSGLLTEKRDNAEKGPVYTYTVDGKLLTRKWARKDAGGNDLVTTYSYDGETGELTGVDYSDSTPDVTFAYDRMGRQQQITDAAGTRVFGYNADFSLASEAITGIYDKVLSRSYDSAPGVKGRYAGFSTGVGYSVSYGYDQKGRMNQVSWNVNSVPGATDYSYVPDSDLLAGMSTARTDGAYTPVTATYTYEDKRDVKTQVLNKAGARIISQYDYRYNSIGNRTSVVNSGEAFGSQYPASSPENREGFNLYSYNSRSEVTESKRYSGTEVDNPVDIVKPEYRSYAYDPIGNRTDSAEGCDATESGKTSTYTANGLNQYESATTGTSASCGAGTGTSGLADGATSFTYDADGNMTGVSDATGYTVYSFDCENRLVDVTVQIQATPVRKVTFAYDFMGRRIKKDVYVWTNPGPDPDSFAWSLDSARTFTWDGWLMTDETATASTPNAQPETTSYVWGLDLSRTLVGAGGVGGLLSMTDNGANNFICYLYDANGNVTQLVDSNVSNLTAKYEYDAYGRCSYDNATISIANAYKFSTKYFDNNILVLYYGNRFYNVMLGRWINKDPSGEISGYNLYIFSSNNTNKYIDWLGLDNIIIAGGVSVNDPNGHDHYPDSFLKAAILRAQELQKKYKAGNDKDEKIYIIMYTPSYQRRARYEREILKWKSREEDDYYLKDMQRKAKEIGFTLITINRYDELTAELNKFGDKKVSSIDYYGHSNPGNIFLEYSSVKPEVSTDMWNIDDARKVHKDIL